MKKSKNKAEYLRKKALKQESKNREAEHKVDYTKYNPTRDAETPHRDVMDGQDPMAMLALMPLLFRKRGRRLPIEVAGHQRTRNEFVK